jgi:hypothetical protein
VDLGDFIADPFPGKHFPPSGIILSQKGRIIKKETVYPQITQRGAAATKIRSSFGKSFAQGYG